MSMFADAGYGQGILNFQNKSSKRRAEVAKLFEEYKRNNPYATADDYTHFIETLAGPSEYYLRGALPAGDILQRMEQDNLKKKAQDERMAFNELAAKNLAVGNQIREQAEKHILNYEDPIEFEESMLESFIGADAPAEEKEHYRKWMRNQIGSYDAMRDRRLREVERSAFKDFMELATETPDADFNFLWENTMPSGKYPANSLKGMKDRFQAQWNRKQEEWENDRKEREYDAISAIGQNQMLARKMAAGSEMRADAEREIDRIMDLKFRHIKDPQRKAEVRQEIMNSLEHTRSILLESEREKKLTTHASALTKAFQAEQDMQVELLSGQSADMKNEVGKAMVNTVARLFKVPQHLRSNLLAYANETEADEANEAMNEWIGSLSAMDQKALVPADTAAQRAMEAAQKLVPKHETADSFLQDSKKMVNQSIQTANTYTDSIAKELQVSTGLPTKLQELLVNIDAVAAGLQQDMSGYRDQVDTRMRSPETWIKGNVPLSVESVDAQLINPLMNDAATVLRRLQALKHQVEVELNNMGAAQASQQLNDIPPAAMADPGRQLQRPRPLTRSAARDPEKKAQYEAQMRAYEEAEAKRRAALAAERKDQWQRRMRNAANYPDNRGGQ